MRPAVHTPAPGRLPAPGGYVGPELSVRTPRIHQWWRPDRPGSSEPYSTYASANPICAAIIIRYMCRQEGWFSVSVSEWGSRTSSQTV